MRARHVFTFFLRSRRWDDDDNDNDDDDDDDDGNTSRKRLQRATVTLSKHDADDVDANCLRRTSDPTAARMLYVHHRTVSKKPSLKKPPTNFVLLV